MEKQSLSELITEYTLKFSLNDVPKEVQEHAKLLLIDSFGVAIAAHQLEYAKGIRRTIAELHSRPDSTLWGTTYKASMADAVLVNASMIHGLDYDDTHVGGVVHPSAGIVSTAFVVGETVGASGRDILEAIICGYEIIVRLALAARGGFHDRGFHCTGIVTPFAAACVAAKLLHLSKSVLLNALGICGSQAAALQEFLHDGSLVKKIHPAWASHAAIYALMLAKGGLTGPYEVFEGGFGLYESHIGSNEGINEAFEDLNEKWRTAEIAVKLYPCCHMIHSFSDCIFDLQHEYNFTASEVARVECRIETRCHKIVCVPEEAKKRPDSEYGMLFSLPYIVAMSLIKGKISPAEIGIQHMQDGTVRNLIDKVECIEDESIKNPGYFPGWVKIILKNGKEYIKKQKYERGTAQNPISEKEIIAKYKNNAIINLNADTVDNLLAKLKRFDKLENIKELLSLMMME